MFNAAAPAITNELSLLRIGGGIAARKVGPALFTSTAVNIMQNGGDPTKIDAFDIGMGAVFAMAGYTDFKSGVILGGINSMVDYNLGDNGWSLNYIGRKDGKSIGQVGLDFSFSLFGESLKTTFGTLGGSNETVNLFTDVIVGNVGSNAVSVAPPNSEK